MMHTMEFREFDTGQAVVQDVDGSVLWQLEKPYRKKGIWFFSHMETFPTKALAEQFAKHMGFTAANVTRYTGRLGFPGYAIKYDLRQDYFLACWE